MNQAFHISNLKLQKGKRRARKTETYRIEWRLRPCLAKPFHLEGDTRWGAVRVGLNRVTKARAKRALADCRKNLAWQGVASKGLRGPRKARLFEFRKVKNGTGGNGR